MCDLLPYSSGSNRDNPHYLNTAGLDECRQFTRTTQDVAGFSEYDFAPCPRLAMSCFHWGRSFSCPFSSSITCTQPYCFIYSTSVSNQS